MKNTFLHLLATGLLTAVLFSFDTAATSIKGKVLPSDAATEVWAISGNDSSKAPITDGSFYLDEKPGTYKVVIVAKVPYKDVIKDNVQVANGTITDMWVIRLQQ